MNAENIHKIIALKVDYIHKSASQGMAISEEEIHELRVTYKKLRAFLRLAAFVRGNVKGITPRKLKDLYQAAGVIRDYQLHEKEIIDDTGCDLGNYAHFLTLRIEESKIKLCKISESVIDKTIIKKISARLPKKISKKAQWNYLAAKEKELLQVAAGVHTDIRLHSIRKTIKDILYLLDILGLEKSYSKRRIKKYKKLSDALGLYNDIVFTLGDIEHNKVKDLIPLAEQEILSAKKQQLLARKAEQQKKITSILNYL
jgi:CHAD domain-containing protein